MKMETQKNVNLLNGSKNEYSKSAKKKKKKKLPVNQKATIHMRIQ